MTCCSTNVVRVCVRDDAWLEGTMHVRDSAGEAIDLTGVSAMTCAFKLNDDEGATQFTLSKVSTDIEGFRVLSPPMLGDVAVAISPATLQDLDDTTDCALLRGSLIITWANGRTSSRPLELQIEGVA